MMQLLLLYASTGGNTEITMEKIAEGLRAHGHDPVLLRAERATPTDLEDFEVVVWGCPTYGHGVLQQHMEDFLKKVPKEALTGKRCAVVGLGDGKYDPYYLIESATILEEFVRGHGGTILLEALRINKSPLSQLNGSITIWAERLAASLTSTT